MSRFNTGNPIGSADPRDRDDNSKNLDEAVNSSAGTFQDRLGVWRKTWSGIEDEIGKIVISGGQLFESEQAGLDATQDGGYFYVAGGGPGVLKTLYRRVDGNNAEFIGRDVDVSDVIQKTAGSDYPEFVVAAQTGEILGMFDGSGRGEWLLPNLRPSATIYGSTKVVESDTDNVWSIATENGGLIAAIGQDGVLKVAGLEVMGEEPKRDTKPEYVVPRLSQESIDSINSQPVLQGNGDPMPRDVVPPMLSIDSAEYGWRYAHLAPSVAWTGDRLWLAAYGQNTRDGDKGEGNDGFTFLLYSDNPFDDDPVWHEILYLVPRDEVFDTNNNQIKDPMICRLPDGRLLLQASTFGECFGVVISNPEATTASFVVGRIHWTGNGIPSRPKQMGQSMFTAYDDWASKITTLREITYPELDTIYGVDYVEIPVIADLDDWQFPETAFDLISGGRILAIQRTAGPHVVTTSEPGGKTWTQPLTEWTEHDSTNTRPTQGRSPSGRLVRVWNDNAWPNSSRINLTVGLSEDDGETFPWTFMIKTHEGGRSVSYPSIDFIEKEGDIVLTIAYDHGRLYTENGRTQIAFVNESAVRNGASPSDLRIIDAVFAEGAV